MMVARLLVLKAVLVALLVLLAPSAHAETYNFYFDTRAVKKNQAMVAPAPRAESNFSRNRRFSADVESFYGNRSSRSSLGLLGGANVSITEMVRAEVFAGATAVGADAATGSRTFFGAETQLLPLHLALGSSHRVTDLGLVVGINNFHKIDNMPVSLHVGPMVSARVSERLSVVGSVRANLGSVLAGGGLSVRL